MPRRLSDPEWVAFQNSVNVEALRLPPWGAVVQWGGQFILVYICPGTGSLCYAGEVMLSDISDRADLIRNLGGTYDQAQHVWVYYIPQEMIGRFYEVAESTLQATGKIIKEVAETAGEAAGGLTKPLVENLAPLLIAAVVVFLIVGLPKR